ncbi:MAG: peptidoglycan-binding protein [Oscillospiraceae bacterium]|nr:peptidoglycan-binding protein [Oscillospiraceae bacterium]
MSNKNLARRTEIAIKINGVKVSKDMNKYLSQLTYTDNEEDKTDDLQISIDDREGVWIKDWMKQKKQPKPAPPPKKTNRPTLRKGARGGDAKYMQSLLIKNRQKLPIYGVDGIFGSETEAAVRGFQKAAGLTVNGVCDSVMWAKLEGEGNESGAKAVETTVNGSISAVIVQKNWNSDGKDRVLDCGVFEIDSLDTSGPPANVSIKGTSLPHSSTMRTQKKTRAWENVKLSAIAKEIAKKSGLKCMFESATDPLYKRREQVQVSDIVFLRRLCKSTGISLKQCIRKQGQLKFQLTHRGEG